MRAALGANRLAAEGAVFDPRDDFVGAVAVVKRAHHFKVRLTAVGAGLLIYDEVTGVAFVFTLLFGNFIEALVCIRYFPLF